MCDCKIVKINTVSTPNVSAMEEPFVEVLVKIAVERSFQKMSAEKNNSYDCLFINKPTKHWPGVAIGGAVSGKNLPPPYNTGPE